jgi:DHA3 family macrolide efflux protein-like MFS transporter
MTNSVEPTNERWAPRFFTLWTGEALSLLGSQLVQFAIIWYLTQQTNSATTLAIASLMGLLPQVLLSPFIGTWVDRGNRRLILIFADITVAVATLVLLVLFWLNLAQVWHIYLMLFVRAVASGFHQSAFGASIVLLVPKDQLARVQGFNQALYGGLNIISAPLGAFLYGVLPMQGILSIDVLTALIAVTIVFFTQIPQPPRDAASQATFFQDFVAGFRYIITWRGLTVVLGMVMVINFFYTAAESLTPILIAKHFRGSVENLGVWQAMFAIGTILGGILLGTWGGFKKRVVTAQVGLIVLGLSTLLIGFTPSDLLLVALVINTLGGLVLPIVNGSFGAILQSVIAPEMQGRVFAFIMSAATLVSPLGLMIAGPISDLFGVPLWFRIAGITCALMGVAGFFIHEVMQMEEEKTGLTSTALNN